MGTRITSTDKIPPRKRNSCGKKVAASVAVSLMIRLLTYYVKRKKQK